MTRFSFSLTAALLAALPLLSGCDKLGFGAKQSNALGNRPDLDCIIANDFYAVHFSAYIQPEKPITPPTPKPPSCRFVSKSPAPARCFSPPI